MSDETLKIKTIVVCIDFTAASNLALLYARRFAVHSGAKLLLVHIIDPARVSPEEMEAHLALHDIVDSAKTDMQKIWTELAENGIVGSWIVRLGNVRDMILDAVQENHADLMVLGSKGMALTGGSRFGTVAEQLVRAAPCPVLTVVPESRWQELENDHRRLLLVPTNFSPASQAAFLYALAFAKSAGCVLLLVHAVEDSFAVEPIAGQLAKLRAKGMQMLLVSARAAHVEAESIIRTGDAIEIILDLAGDRNADYIVMGVRGGDLIDGTRLHGRVQHLMRRSPCPLFSIYLGKSQAKVLPGHTDAEKVSLIESHTNRFPMP
ncbi:MAG: universal stress protein [Acidobacteriaceae bacterium]